MEFMLWATLQRRLCATHRARMDELIAKGRSRQDAGDQDAESSEYDPTIGRRQPSGRA